MVRNINCYYNLARRGWCTASGGLIPERQYPHVNLWETPRFNIKFINDDELPITADGLAFTATLTDTDDNIIAVPSETEMSEIETDPVEEGEEAPAVNYDTISIVFNISTVPALALVDTEGRADLWLNLFLDYSGEGESVSIAAPVILYKVFKATAVPTPVPINSQYRINPTDGGTDIWDYGREEWMRGVLENGVLSYYPAP